jgi:WD40 repeat protein/serine/threonine protein kinase/tetratricopeptide (TPR) repeat protein
MAEPASEQSIFLEALALPAPAERAAYLDEACRDKPTLRAEVEALLAAHERLGGGLPPTTGGESAEVVAGPPPGTGGADGAVGAVLSGRYKLVQPIGEGGMGTVWMAQQTEPVKRLVALKVIKPGMDSKQVLGRFEAERQALAVMDHPNIARVLDAGATAAGRPYFVMELVKGVPLMKYCDEHRLTPRERLELFVGVCQAIQHAHQKGVIHRDVKPTNVLVARYDGRPVPKVIDFGVAKATGPQLTEHTLVTGFGAVVGTLEYMSPEQAELNQLDIDTRSDIYSLGVLLYELLTGTTPLEKKRLKQASMLEVLRLIREEEPPKPSTRLSSTEELPSVAANRGLERRKLSGLVRGELDWIVMKALEKDRRRRYETANGLALDVQRYLADEPVLAGPPSTTYRLRKFARRNRGVLTAATLVSTALVLAVVVLAISNVRINDALGQAKTNAETADQRAEDLARRHYIDQVNLAQREVMANNVARADALLADCEPSRRGWEWAYTKRLCHHEAMTLGGFRDHASAVAGARRASPATLALLAAHDPDGLITGWGAGNGSVRGVAYSPDGRRIASAHDDGSIVLWDARTGREIRSLTGHLGCVSSVTFDDDGGRLISGGFDGTVRVWDANTGQQKFVLPGHSRPVMSVAFRPGANQAASSEVASYNTMATLGFEIKQWDLLRGREIRTLHQVPGWSYSVVAFTPDGRRLLSSWDWSGQLDIWDAESGKQIETRRHPNPFHGLSVSPADGRLAFGYQDGTVGLSGPGLGRDIQSLRGHSSLPVVAFSRDGRRLASAGEDGAIQVWSVADGSEVTHLRGHTGGITALAFSPKGNFLVSSSADGTVKIWHIGYARDPYPLTVAGWGNRVRFAPDGRRTAIAFSALWVVDSTSGRTLFHINYPLGVRALGFSRDGRLIATGASDEVRLLDAETGQSVAKSQRHVGIRAVAFGAGNLLASAGDDGTVRFWDVPTGQAGSVLDAHPGGILSVAFDPAGTMLASLGSDGTVCLWDAPKSRLIRRLGRMVPSNSDHGGPVLAFSPDGRRLAVACADETVHVWEVASGDEVFTLRGHTGAVTSVAYSPDGRRIASAGWDHTIKLWDAATGDEVFTLRGHTRAILGLDFSPDGFRLLSTGADSKVRAWDATPLEVKPTATLEPREVAEWDEEGAWCVSQSRWDEAVAAFHKVIALEPTDLSAYGKLGMASLRRNGADRNDLVAACRKAVELYPKMPAAHVALGQLVIKTNSSEAVTAFQRAIEVTPNDVNALLWVGQTLLSAGTGSKEELMAALAAYSKVLDLHPANSGANIHPANIWCDRGNIYRRLGQRDKALADYNQAIALMHDHWAALIGRGAIYAEMGRWDEAIADYSNSLKRVSTYAQVWFMRGQAYQKLGKWNLAVADYHEAIRLAPQPSWQNDLAWLLATCPEPKIRKPQQAVELANAAVTRMPREGTFWNTLGVAHYRAGDWKAAVAAFDKSMEFRAGGDAFDWLFLAMVHEKLGNRDEARKRYDQAVQWLEKNGPMLTKTPQWADELRRFRAEAEEVLGLKKN